MPGEVIDRTEVIGLLSELVRIPSVNPRMGDGSGEEKIALYLADIAGTKVWAEYIPYSVSKAGLMALTKGLAKALAPTVQVNAKIGRASCRERV